jgi:HK97 gp10 family phage protein
VIILAKVEFTMPDDFLDKISRLEERTDEIVPRMLEAGGEVVLEQVRRNLQVVVGKGTKLPSRSTGELVSALGLSPAKMDRDGNFNVKIGFDEPRHDARRSGASISNAMLGSILEHGKHGQPPKPFLKPAKSAAKSACIDAMKKKLEDEVNGV